MSLESLRVVVDVQHLYRARHPNDRGARFALENGTHVWEADAALIYADAIGDWLEARGVPVLRNDPTRGILTGPYQRRHRAVESWGATAYLACHLNSGRGAYALLEVMEDRDDTLARAIGTELVKVPELQRFERRWLAVEDRGSVCIRFVKDTIPAVLCEPFFGDQLAHQPLLAPHRLRQVGEAIAQGVEAWWRDRRGLQPPPVA
jgi:N-acetylmuramoyl-L-alanine amidase